MMSVFDKICAVIAFGLGIVLLILGFIGLFLGCKANFSLPPVLGVLPAFAGWGIIRSIMLAWNSGSRRTGEPRQHDRPTFPDDLP